MQQAGELTEEWFEDHGIPADLEECIKKVKDVRAVHKRRAVVLTNSAFGKRLEEQEKKRKLAAEEQKESTRVKKAKREEAKKAKEKEIDRKRMRKEALANGPKSARADDCRCYLCAATFYGYVDYGLGEVWEQKGGRRVGVENIWKQCEQCERWFCPDHSSVLGGAYGHEASCRLDAQQNPQEKPAKR